MVVAATDRVAWNSKFANHCNPLCLLCAHSSTASQRSDSSGLPILYVLLECTHFTCPAALCSTPPSPPRAPAFPSNAGEQNVSACSSPPRCAAQCSAGAVGTYIGLLVRPHSCAATFLCVCQRFHHGNRHDIHYTLSHSSLSLSLSWGAPRLCRFTLLS